jgi:hypothetical protein
MGDMQMAADDFQSALDSYERALSILGRSGLAAGGRPGSESSSPSQARDSEALGAARIRQDRPAIEADIDARSRPDRDGPDSLGR